MATKISSSIQLQQQQQQHHHQQQQQLQHLAIPPPPPLPSQFAHMLPPATTMAAASILNNLSHNRTMLRRNNRGYNEQIMTSYAAVAAAAATTAVRPGEEDETVGGGGGEDDDGDDDDDDDDDDEDEDDEEEENDEEEDDNDDPNNYQDLNGGGRGGSCGDYSQQQRHSLVTYQSPSYSSNSAPITFAPFSAPSSAAKKRRANACLNDPALLGEVIQVNCNSVVAELHKKKFGSGGKGHCIRIIIEDKHSDGKPQEKWMTPIEFESYCGKGNCRDWKRTIKAGGQPLVAILNAKILVCHAVSCSCAVCNRNDSLVGPIKPFIRYKRRKKDQIMAENAFKKFLSLKPPTLFRDTMPTLATTAPSSSSGLVAAAASSAASSVSSSSSLQLSSLSQNSSTAPPPSKSLPQSLTIGSNHHSLHVAAANSSYDTNAANELISQHLYSNSNTGSNNGNMNGFKDMQHINGNDDLYDFIEQFQENEDRKWYNLEQFAENLCAQARALKSSIASAKHESERTRRLIIDRLVTTLSMSSPSPSSSQNSQPQHHHQQQQQHHLNNDTSQHHFQQQHYNKRKSNLNTPHHSTGMPLNGVHYFTDTDTAGHGGDGNDEDDDDDENDDDEDDGDGSGGGGGGGNGLDSNHENNPDATTYTPNQKRTKLDPH